MPFRALARGSAGTAACGQSQNDGAQHAGRGGNATHQQKERCCAVVHARRFQGSLHRVIDGATGVHSGTRRRRLGSRDQILPECSCSGLQQILRQGALVTSRRTHSEAAACIAGILPLRPGPLREDGEESKCRSSSGIGAHVEAICRSVMQATNFRGSLRDSRVGEGFQDPSVR